MCEKPFIHEYAFKDVKTFILFFVYEVKRILPKFLNMKGILNVGGEIQSVYSLLKNQIKNVKKFLLMKVFHKIHQWISLNLKKS